MSARNGTISPDIASLAVSRRHMLAGAAAGIASLIAPAATTAQAAPAIKLRRGGSIHTMLNWPTLEAGSREKIAWPPFAAAKYQISPELLKAFRRAGLDFIRMTVDPGLILSTPKTRHQDAISVIIDRCKLLLSQEFSIVVDFHPIYQLPLYTPEKLISNPELFSGYTSMLAQTAAALVQLPARRIALEVFNEPPYGYDLHTSRRWNAMLHNMHRSIRAAAPALPLVLSGAAGGSIQGLLNVDARKFNDPNILWSFHYYDPHLFTHQGVETSQENMLWYRHLTDLPYPAARGNAAMSMEAFRQNLKLDPNFDPERRQRTEKEAAKALGAYFSSNFSRASIAADFDKVAAWAKSNRIPDGAIFLGEFGAARRNEKSAGALETHRIDWMRDIRLEAQARGFIWALWDINAPQMGLVRPNGAGLDASLLDALGLQGESG